MKGKFILCLVLATMMAMGISAYAADYPTKPIMFQVPYPPGGSTDVGARIAASIPDAIQPVSRYHLNLS